MASVFALATAIGLGLSGAAFADNIEREFERYVTEPCMRFAVRNAEKVPGVSEDQMVELMMLLQGPKMAQSLNQFRNLLEGRPLSARIAIYDLARMACESGVAKGKK